MISGASSTKLVRALWQRGGVSPSALHTLPSVRHSTQLVNSSRLSSFACSAQRPSHCVRCKRPLQAAFSTSTATSTSGIAHPTAAPGGPPLPPPPPPRRSQYSPPPPTSSHADELRDRNRRVLKYVAAVAIFALGASYAAVPLYRLFCQHTGYGGTTQRDTTTENLSSLAPSDRQITITFTADTSPALHWQFHPSQTALTVAVGQPTLAFYRATNTRPTAVTGVATYNVTPLKTGLYFHKIQCFCFDEQRLRGGESVDMPVFFYIDPAIEEDVRCRDVKHITLSYTFFEMKGDEEEEEEEDEKEGEGQAVVAAA